MALQCSLSLNANSYAAGQTPPPMATLTVYNPNAVAVSVTSIQLNSKAAGDTAVNRTAMAPTVAPTGPGMLTSVPATSSITIGPFPIVVASAANANPFGALGPRTDPLNPQGSQSAAYTLIVGADVFGSDGSFNTSTPVAVLVTSGFQPPPGAQGGVLQFNSATNSAGVIPGWP